MEDCIPWEEPHSGAGKVCEGKEWPIKMYNELTIIAHSPFCLCHLEGRKVRSEVKPGKNNGWGKGVFKFCFISHFSAVLLIGIKLN